ncbi:MAG TPA: hypothetical protein VK066_27435 [Chloroflexota bacterium]|nr:hypothetical protein [Chloroflexota bacterium]
MAKGSGDRAAEGRGAEKLVRGTLLPVPFTADGELDDTALDPLLDEFLAALYADATPQDQ